MTELRVLEEAVSAHLPTLLHGAEDAANVGLQEMVRVCDDGPLFGALCGMFAQVAGDALREVRASAPAGPMRAAEFGVIVPTDASLGERVALQVITATANGDRQTMLALLGSALSWPGEADLTAFVCTLGARARVLHQSVCDDSTRDFEAGA